MIPTAPMTLSVKSFDVVVVPIPASDALGGVAPRPALVVTSEAHHRTGHVIVAMITSVQDKMPGDVPITNWADLGLPKPSKIRTAKLATFDLSALHRRLGSIDPEAQTAVRAYLRKFIDV